MSRLSRREFFQKLKPGLPVEQKAGAREELPLGAVANFPFGSECRVFVGGHEVGVAAEAEGLRAELVTESGSRPLWLRLGNAGQVFALPGRACPPEARLSLMTGEMSGTEEGSSNE